jgi:hypothetical protein
MVGRQSSSARMTRLRARLAEFWVRLGALCVIALFVTASVTSGKAYLWCVPMQQARHDCCCDAAHGPDQELRLGEYPTIRESCCDSQVIGELPAARVPPPVDGVPPALVTAVGVLPVLVEPPRGLAQRWTSLPPRLRRYGPTRAGPRSASDTCIKLQVFRC